jgi:2-phosphosulfolactate phosphatase
MKNPDLFVHLLPDLIPAGSLNGGTAVVIDILRASTTITTALAAGASAVIPCQTPDAAFAMRERLAGVSVLLGGERGGVRIEGFDLGNSPAEYPSAVVEGRTVVFTTTNGTRALQLSATADQILIGAFVNRTTLRDRLNADQKSVHLVCAGTNGGVTGEDVLFAGCAVEDLLMAATPGVSWQLNDSAELALRLWRSVTAVPQAAPAAIEKFLQTTQGGRNLLQIGFGADLERCSHCDNHAVLPEFDKHAGQLLLHSGT